MTNYTSRKFKNFDDFLSDILNKNDRVLMKKELIPIITELKQNKINLPHDFVDIMNRFNLPRLVINEYMQKFLNIKFGNFVIKLRLINHTNTFEKNTVFTYQAFKSPDIMLDKFKEFISTKYSFFGNKENLFSEIEKEIIKIHGKLTNDTGQSDNPEMPEKVGINIDVDDNKFVYDEFYEELNCDLPTYDNFNDDYLNADLFNYF